MKKVMLLLVALGLCTVAGGATAGVVFQDDFATYDTSVWSPSTLYWPWAYNGAPATCEAVVKDGRTALHMVSNGSGPLGWDGITSPYLLIPATPSTRFEVVFKSGISAPANSSFSLHVNASGQWSHVYVIPTWGANVAAGGEYGWQGLGPADTTNWYRLVQDFTDTGSVVTVYDDASGTPLATVTGPTIAANWGMLAFSLSVANAQGPCEVWIDRVAAMQPVPEPASILALGSGLVGVLFSLRRRSF